MHREYDPASARLTLNGREVSPDTVVNVPRRMMGSASLVFAAAAIFGGVGGGYAVASPPDEFDAHESMHRTALAMLNAPRRVVTAEDVARIERAKAKRARKAAARRVS